MNATDKALLAKLEAAQVAGESEAMNEHVVGFITRNYGPTEWLWAADQCVAHGLKNAYTDLRMRAAESGY